MPDAYYIGLAAYDGREAKRTECRGSTRSLQQTTTATADRRLFHGFSWWMDGTLGTRPGRADAFDSRVGIIQRPLPCPAVTPSRRPAGRLTVIRAVNASPPARHRPATWRRTPRGASVWLLRSAHRGGW